MDRVIFIATAVVAAFASAIAVLLFSISIDVMFAFVSAHAWVAWCLPVAGLATYGIYRLLKVPYSTTNGTVTADVASGRPVRLAVAPAVFAGSCLSILGAASIGKEAGAFQIGAAFASKLGRVMQVADEFREALGLAGMAAGFTILLGTPVAVALFVCETVSFKRLTPFGFVAVLIAACVGQLVLMSVGMQPLWGAHVWSSLSNAWPQLAMFGVLCALVGAAYAAGLEQGKRLVAKLPGSPLLPIVVAGVLYAAVVTAGGLWDVAGTGAYQMHRALAGDVSDPLFVGKIAATLVVLCCGFKGGEITPMMCIGATFGSFFGVCAGIDPGCCAALGIVALMASSCNCPLAAMAFAFEAFGVAGFAFSLVPVALAFALACPVSIYDNKGLWHALKRLSKRP